MRFIVSYVTAMFGGGHTTLSLVGEFLTRDCPDFGAAINSFLVEIFIRLPLDKPPGSPADTLLRNADAHINKMPQYRFARKQSTYTIKYESKVLSAGTVKKTSSSLDEDIFKVCILEVEQQLRIVANKLKNEPDFDSRRFLSWLDSKVQEVDTSLPWTVVKIRRLFANRVQTV